MKLSLNKNVLSFFSCILLLACANNHENTRFTEEQAASLELDKTTILKANSDSIIKVDLNPFLGKKEFDFGSLVEQVKILPLETTDKSLVGGINKVIITESHIYIMDRFKKQGLIIFDRNGKFVKRLSHGQGPGELFRLYDFSYDEINKKLIVYQHPFLMTFSPSGKYISQEKLPLGFYNFTSIPNGYLLKTIDGQGNPHMGNMKNYTLLLADKDFKIKSVAFNRKPYGKAMLGHFYIYKNENIISLTERYVDTIYQYQIADNKLKAKYVMDYSEKRLPQKYAYSNSWEEFDNATGKNDYNYYLGQYLETETKNLFFLSNDYLRLRTIVYRDKQTGNMKGGAYANFKKNEIPPIAFPISAYKDYFISVYNPGEKDSILLKSPMISDEDKEQIKNIKEGDNPMLVFFKMKGF